MGMIYKRGNVWWIKYHRHGKPYRETTRSTKEADAKRLLKRREGEISEGKLPGVYFDRVWFEDLAGDFLTDYRVNGKRSLDKAEAIIERHLRPFFAGIRATDITTAGVKKYIEHRQGEGAANATINRDLSALKRMFSLGAKCTPPKVAQVPYIPMLAEDNTRTGFFEHGQFLALRQALPEEYRPIITLAYKTGWRKSEILGLSWARVDIKEGTVRLEARETKNKDPRTVYLDEEGRNLLREQFQKRRLGCDLVFHRDGKRIRNFRKAWASACKATGLKDRILHDFRRTAIRNMVRAGVPERVAMTISGHKTRSVFERYNIVSPDDLKRAAASMERYFEAQLGTIPGTVGHFDLKQIVTKSDVSTCN